MALRNIWSLAATVTVLVMVPGRVLSHFSSIDDIIAESTNSTKDFDFNFDLGFQDVRVEMDMIFSGDQWNNYQSVRGIVKRKAIIPGSEGKLWTDGVIPYDFEPFTFSEVQKQEILAAMNDYQKYSCLTFRQATNADVNKIVFKNGGGCFSRVGMFGGAQEIGLAPGCREKRVVIHELGHALGLHHEQTRPDRDGYVKIISSNIAPAMQFNFDRHSWNVVQDYDVPYDYFSIMHYGKTAFSINKRITMETTDPKYQNVIGTQSGLSFRDIKIINLMYLCVSSCSKTVTECPSVGFLGKDCQCWCPGDPYKVCDGTETEDPGPGGVTGGQKVVQGCSDSDVNCPMWARAGYCVNPSFTASMSASCRLSCHLCGESKVVQPCGDSDVNCPMWARAGHCVNPSFTASMSASCRLSCHLCGESKGVQGCSDSDVNCPRWAGTGYCVNPSFTAYMSASCRLSCHLCGESKVVQACSDSDVNCPMWARAGHCVNPLFTVYMSASCRLSCQLCGGRGIYSPSVCQNVDMTGNCDIWAQTGLCQRVPDFMLAQCMRSCNACNAAPASPTSPPPPPPPPPPRFSSTPPLPSVPSSLPSMPSALPLLPLPPPPSSTCMDYSASCLFWQVQNMCVLDPYFMNVCCPFSCGIAMCAAPTNSLATFCNT